MGVWTTENDMGVWAIDVSEVNAEALDIIILGVMYLFLDSFMAMCI
jgi:hypothetical protein